MNSTICSSSLLATLGSVMVPPSPSASIRAFSSTCECSTAALALTIRVTLSPDRRPRASTTPTPTAITTSDGHTAPKRRHQPPMDVYRTRRLRVPHAPPTDLMRMFPAGSWLGRGCTLRHYFCRRATPRTTGHSPVANHALPPRLTGAAVSHPVRSVPLAGSERPSGIGASLRRRSTDDDGAPASRCRLDAGVAVSFRVVPAHARAVVHPLAAYRRRCTDGHARGDGDAR